jgi:hypothetical protein
MWAEANTLQTAGGWLIISERECHGKPVHMWQELTVVRCTRFLPSTVVEEVAL